MFEMFPLFSSSSGATVNSLLNFFWCTCAKNYLVLELRGHSVCVSSTLLDDAQCFPKDYINLNSLPLMYSVYFSILANT